MPGPTPTPILAVTDLEGDTSAHINVGLLEVPAFDSTTNHDIIITFPEGWSMFSFPINVLNLNPDYWNAVDYPLTNPVKMSHIFEQFLYETNPNGEDYPVYNSNDPSEYNSAVIIIKNNNGLAYLPEWGFDGMGDEMQDGAITVQFAGFQIKMGGPGYYLKLNGPYYEPTSVTTQNFTLNNGWNMIGVPFETCTVSAEVYVQEFVDKVIIMKNYLGHAYLPEWDFNGIGNMEVTKGYQLKLQNHTSGNDLVVTHATGGGVIGDPVDPFDDPIEDPDPIDDVIDDIIDDTPIIDDIINIDDTPIIADTNMTIKVPGDIVINILDEIDLTPVVKQKIKLLDALDSGGRAQQNQDIQNVLEAAVQILEEEKKENPKSDTEKESDFIIALRDVQEKFPSNGDPLRFSPEVLQFINYHFSRAESFTLNDGTTLRDNIVNFYNNTIFNFSFLIFNSDESLIVGRTNFKIRNYVVDKQIVISVQGDDASTNSEVEGMLLNEVPVIYFFSGYKYYLCTYTVENSSYANAQFADKKEVQINTISLGQPLSEPVYEDQKF